MNENLYACTQLIKTVGLAHKAKGLVFRAAEAVTRRCKVQDTVVLAGAPRSGTTWLAELLRELPGYKFLNEPLLLHNNEEAVRAGFHWRTHLHPSENAVQKRAFFENVLSGQVPHGPLWHYVSKSLAGKLVEHILHQKLIVKFCRLGRLLHWVDRKFDMRGTVLIIRHPCAVIASQLTHGGWDPNKVVHDLDSDAALGDVPSDLRNEFNDILSSLETRIDVMTAVWCLDYYIPLIRYSDYGYPWILVPYERLVLDGYTEMERVFSYLDAEIPGSLEEKLGAASAYASDDLSVTDDYKQLSKWKAQLSSEHIDRILEIVKAFELDFYTKDLEPDYDQLEGSESTTY